MNVTIKNYSSNHIHATIEEDNLSHLSWDFTGIYGYPKLGNKHKTWKLLKTIHQQSQTRWFVCGDFNEVMSHDEKWGCKQKANNLLTDFLTAINNYKLTNLGFKGLKYTWCNNREGNACVSERLDRCLATASWRDHFQHTVVRHGTVAYSDHLPLWVEKEPMVKRRSKHKIFLFEAIWTHETDCQRIIEQIWDKAVNNSSDHALQTKVKECSDHLM